MILYFILNISRKVPYENCAAGTEYGVQTEIKLAIGFQIIYNIWKH